MTAFILRLLDLLRKFFVAVGIDYSQLRAIVEAKLIMDNRRHIISYNQKSKKQPRNAFLATFIIYLLFGSFMGLMLLYYPSFTLSMLIFFSYIMMMITMTLITDFSSVLLDTSDNTIILPRPVDSRTLFAARLIHILVYLGQLTFGLSLIPMIIIGWKYQPALLLFFFIAILLSVLLSLVITNALYLLIMQFTSEERLKNLINYLQIIMTILMVGGYQLGPRMISRMENQSFEISLWSLLAPPSWMTGMMEAIHLNIWDSLHIVATVLTLVIPLAGLYFVNKYLTPIFNRKLGSMGTSTKKPGQKEQQHKSRNLGGRISGWITTSHIERSTFELIFHILGRDRKIKLKIYPSFGYILVFAIVFMINQNQDFSEALSELSGSRYHIFMIYLTFIVLQVAIFQIPYSDDYKASWIYFSAPIEKPGEILTGALKAILIRLFIPGYAVITIAILTVWGVDSIPDLVFGFFNNLLMLLTLVLVNSRNIPFSMAPDMRAQSGTFMRSMVTLIFVGTLGFGHYLIGKFPAVMMACIPLQIGIVYLLLRSYRSTFWSEIRV